MPSSVHHASLVDPAVHSVALLHLIDLPMSPQIIEYVADCVIETVDYAMGRPTPSARPRFPHRRPENAMFTTFVSTVIHRAEITTPTVLAALVYIDRAKPHLQIALEEWALERVFLGAIIVASKYLNDSTLKNVHWALCTGVFGKRDVGRIEREYLDVLDFELAISEADLLSHHQGLAGFTLLSPAIHHSRPYSSIHHAAARSTLPELEPSHTHSPLSSSDSFSPQTPELEQSYSREAMRVQSPVKRGSTTMDILRSFPLPLPQTHAFSALASNQVQDQHSQFPFRVTA